MSRIFISHSSADDKATVALQKQLEAHGHKDLFHDADPEKGIKAGIRWELELYTQLRACDAVVVLCSRNYLASHWCFAEIALARMEGKEIFALKINPWNETGESKTVMPSILTEGQCVDLTIKPEEGYERLWRGFKAKGIVPAEFAEWQPTESPYPGLRAFEKKDAPIFFGREKEVQEGVELLNTARRQGHPRLVMVLGASGSGKSSLARAGIVPRLDRDQTQWQVVGPFRPGPLPARQLAFALSQAFDKAGRAVPAAELLGRLAPAVAAPADADEPEVEGEPARERLLEALRAFQADLVDDDAVDGVLKQLETVLEERAARADAPRQGDERGDGRPGDETQSTGNPLADLAVELQHGSDSSVVLVIDQFEELLGHDGESHPANRLLRLLREAVEVDGTPLLVLATMRSDYLEPFQMAPEFLGLGFKKLSVGPMSRDGMRKVIEKPAILGGLKLDDGLTDLLMDDIGSSDALPLLAFTLRVMWERRADKHRLGRREYDALGGLEGAIGKVADEALEAALARGKGDRKSRERDLRDAFLRLARSGGDGSRWARQPASWDKLPVTVRPMIQHFVDQRLLARKGKLIEVVHEALFRSWDKLRHWLSEDAERLHLLSEIRIDAAKWSKAEDEEKDSYLWRKGRLLRAVELRNAKRLDLEEDELAFLETAEDVENRARLRKRRRQRWLVKVASAVALVMAALGVWAVWGMKVAEQQRRNARIQGAKALAIQSRTAGFPFDQSLLASVEAGRVLERVNAAAGDLYEVKTALVHLLLRHPTLDAFLHGHEDRIWTIAFSPDLAHLASGSTDGRLLLWDLDRRRALWNLDLCDAVALPPDKRGSCGELVKRVEFSPDGTRLAASGDTGKIVVWNVSTREAVELQRAGTPVEALAFAPPDGESLASGDGEGRVRVWDLADLAAKSHVELRAAEPGLRVSRVAFTQDGESLMSAGSDKAVRLWDVSRDSPGRVLCRSENTIYGLRISSQGVVAAGFNDGHVVTWREDERPAARCLAKEAVDAHQGEEVRDLAFSPDGQQLASAGYDGVVWLWDVATFTRQTRLDGHVRGAWTVDIGPEGTVATGAHDGAIRLWDPRRRRPRRVETDHESRVKRVAFGGKGLAATGAATGTIRVTSLPDLGPSPGPSAQEDEITGLAISPDERLLAASIGSKGVRVWDLVGGDPANGKDLEGPILEHDRHKALIRTVAFSPDSRWVASSDDDGFVWLWQLPEDQHRLLIGCSPSSEDTRCGSSVMSLAFHPLKQGSVLALGRSTGEIEVWDTGWDTGTKQRLKLFEGHKRSVADLAFSPDGGRLASTGPDRSVRVWSLEEASELFELRGHQAYGQAVAFSPDGGRLVSGDAAGVIRVWDAEIGLPLYGLLGDQDAVLRLAFDQEGWLVSGHSDKTLRRWQIGLVEPLELAYERACRIANRNLGPREWAKFFGEKEYRKTCPGLP